MQDHSKGNARAEAGESPKRLYRFIIGVDCALSKAESFVTILCFALMCVFIIVGIVMRFILKMPNMYGEEASRYLMVCGIFIGVSIGVRQKAHLGVTTLVEMLPGKLPKIVFAVAGIITMCGYLALSWYALLFVREMRFFRQTSAAMSVPMYMVYFPIMLGLMLSFIRSVMVFWNDFIAAEKILSDTEEASPW